MDVKYTKISRNSWVSVELHHVKAAEGTVHRCALKTLQYPRCYAKLRDRRTTLILKIEKIGEKNEKYNDQLIIDLPLSVNPILKRFYADKDGRFEIPNAY